MADVPSLHRLRMNAAAPPTETPRYGAFCVHLRQPPGLILDVNNMKAWHETDDWKTALNGEIQVDQRTIDRGLTPPDRVPPERHIVNVSKGTPISLYFLNDGVDEHCLKDKINDKTIKQVTVRELKISKDADGVVTGTTLLPNVFNANLIPEVCGDGVAFMDRSGSTKFGARLQLPSNGEWRAMKLGPGHNVTTITVVYEVVP